MRDLELLREYVLKKEGVTEEYPFDDVTLVFKVKGKMFVLCSLDEDPSSLNLKCEPELAVELREKYPAVQPGYHMNKKHWNTVRLDGTISQKEIFKMIDHSYEMVVKGLPKRKRADRK